MENTFDIKQRLNKIADYIIQKYPDSCLAHNGKDDFSLQEDIQNFFYFERLGWCGCGDPEAVMREICKYFSILDWRDSIRHYEREMYNKLCKKFREAFGVESIYDNPLLMALAYAMDAAGFTDHGTSIGGAWLTDEGKMFLYVLRNNKEIKEGD